MVQYEPNSRPSWALGHEPESVVVPMQMGSGAQKMRLRPSTLMGLDPDGHELVEVVVVALVTAGVGATVAATVGAKVGATVGARVVAVVGAGVDPPILQPYTPDDTMVQ